MELNEFDLEILNSKGISQEKLAEELQMLARRRFPLSQNRGSRHTGTRHIRAFS